MNKTKLFRGLHPMKKLMIIFFTCDGILLKMKFLIPRVQIRGQDTRNTIFIAHSMFVTTPFCLIPG
jgi:hypothetical protein